MVRDNIGLELLNNIFLGVGQLAENVPMGGKNYLEMVCEYYTERMINQYKNNFNPVSNRVIDLCFAWIKLLEKDELVSKEDYQLSSAGDLVYIKVDKQTCPFNSYCTIATKENITLICPRMISLRWVASNFTDCRYQLKTEGITDNNWCQGTIYPGKIISEILAKNGDNISIAGERAIVLSTNAYGVLIKTIYDYAPHLLERVLYESTYYSSLVEYEKVRDYYDDQRQVIEHLLRTVARLGNIRYEIIEFDVAHKRAVIHGYGSYMAEIFKNNNLFTSPKVSCASSKGRLAAYFTKAWEEEMICEEMRCEAFGDDYCKFVLLPKRI